MADSHAAHGHDDPNPAPMHHDIKESFSSGAVLFCYMLALISLVVGVAAGLTIVVD